jgi:hypothetical protein
MKDKFYFRNSYSEKCYNKPYFDAIMKEKGLVDMEVFEAIPDKVPGFFWCKKFEMLGDKSEHTCNKLNCHEYFPANGKRGPCKHFTGKVFSKGDKIILKL